MTTGHPVPIWADKPAMSCPGHAAGVPHAQRRGGEKGSAGSVRSRQQALCRCPRIGVLASPGSRCAQPAPDAHTGVVTCSNKPRQSRHLAAFRLPFCGSLEKRLAHRWRSTPARPCKPGLTIEMTGGAFALVSPVKNRGVLHRFRREASVISSRLPFRSQMLLAQWGVAAALLGQQMRDAAGLGLCIFERKLKKRLPVFISNDDGPAAPTLPLQSIFVQLLTRAPCCFPLCFLGIGEFDAFLIQYCHLATFDVKEIVRHLQKTPLKCPRANLRAALSKQTQRLAIERRFWCCRRNG